MLTAIKYRAYPRPDQCRLLAQMFGNQRFVWNYFLGEQKRRLDAKERLLSAYSMMGMLPALIAEKPWLGESKVDALCTSIEALDGALRKFFKKQSKFPKFKKRHGRQSVTTIQVSPNVLRLNRRLGPIEISEHRPIPVGKRKRLTISHSPSGRYFSSLLVQTSEAFPSEQEVSSVIGIDEGLESFVTLSTGRKIRHGKHYRANLARLRREQRRLSRKTKGSNRRERQRIRVAKLHEKITNSRAYETHLISTNLVRKAVRESQAIAFQKFGISGLLKNHSLALSITDAAWGELRRQLAYKCQRAGVPLIEVDQWEPTSYPCHRCGVKAEGKTLCDRHWVCLGCGSKIDRDINAARNTARLGWNQLRREAPLMDVEAVAVMAVDEASTGASRAKRVEDSN